LIASGLGLLGLGVGAAYGLRALELRDDARLHCDGDLCSAAGVALREDAIRAGDLATAASLGGAVVLAGGLLLVATAPRARSHAAWRASPQVGIGGAGLVLGGSLW
jgi:hypothetical protein